MNNKFVILKEILEKHFIVSKKSNEKSSEIIIKCPYCGDKSDDVHKLTGHYHMYINTETGQFHCFLCNRSGMLPKLVHDFRTNFSLEDVIALSNIYGLYSSNTIISQSSSILNIETLHYNENFHKYLNVIYNKYNDIKNIESIKLLKYRISISERNNDDYLKYILDSKIIFPVKKIKFNEVDISKYVNKSMYFVMNHNNTFMIPFRPSFNGVQLYLPIHENIPKYIIYKIDKDINDYIYIGNNDNPSSIYIVEGIFDALKLYNILDRDTSVGIVVLTGKVKMGNVIPFLQSLNINAFNVDYYVGLDSDVPYDEYVNLIKEFKSYYSFDYSRINILVWDMSSHVKDLGDIISVEQYNKVIKIIPYPIYSLKKIYDSMFKREEVI